MWYTFTSELVLCLSLSIVVILGIILLVTANVKVTILVAMCVGITDIFLFALIHFWELTLNPIVLMHVIVSIGISVDYSAHIGYAYLVEPTKDGLRTKDEIRVYKAKMALRKMGSSVFHGGFSTFIAILVLAPGTTYIFLAFFRLWFGIILFGMANGFMLLPVVLSFIGPTKSVEVEDNKVENKVNSEDDKDSVQSFRTVTTAGSSGGSARSNSDELISNLKLKKKQQIVEGKEVGEANLHTVRNLKKSGTLD